MLAQLSNGSAFGPWEAWLIPAAGFLSALLVFAAFYWLLLRKSQPRRQPSGPPPVKDTSGIPDPFIHGGFGNKRETLRRRGKSIKVSLSDEEMREDLGVAWVHDRSMGGLGLQVEKPFDVGTILSVRPQEAPVSTPWVQVEVRSCRETDMHFELGCQFVRTPTYNVLILFG